MNKFTFLKLSVIYLLFILNQAHGNWAQTSGPGGGEVQSLVANGNNIFAGTRGGVYLSTNKGLSWTAVNTGLPFRSVYGTGVFALGVYDKNIMASTSNGLFLSSDNGTSWTSLGCSPAVIALAMNGDNIFAGIMDMEYVFRLIRE